MRKLDEIRREMSLLINAPDEEILSTLCQNSAVTPEIRAKAVIKAAAWVEKIRTKKTYALMDIFMAEFGLSTEEGVALMCLAEALLRVPDPETMDKLIEDKIAPSNWARHLGHSSSPLVNASTWGLMLTGRILDSERSIASILHQTIKRLSEPVVRQIVRRAIKELGEQFVLGQNINAALKRSSKSGSSQYYSFDMLGEAARTSHDALMFFNAYAKAIKEISSQAIPEYGQTGNVHHCSGVSIKLSALFERYEVAQKTHVMDTLVPRLLILAQMAKDGGIGLNIDAEEAGRLELSMEVIEAVLTHPSLEGWHGFGIVVQAYGKRASLVIDWYYALAKSLQRKVALRLVKGAYWDSEIKHAQVEGHEGFPVFCQKSATDISYIENAARLLDMTDHIYPQFATHNAHTIAIILGLAGKRRGFEFQRLHGMGEALFDIVRDEVDIPFRIYAPVGIHEDLLAYLVRRLLENGANSSFVNQLLDKTIPTENVVADPYKLYTKHHTGPQVPASLFGDRKNSKGWDLQDQKTLNKLNAMREPFRQKVYQLNTLTGTGFVIRNPANLEIIGQVNHASEEDIRVALKRAKPWKLAAEQRAEVLKRAADIYEAHSGEILEILCREAGKTLRDGVAEIREAVDFLRYYSDEALKHREAKPRGIFTSISPWNFPLAIFTGQISAALATGNAVLAKPAESTPIIATRAVEWLHEAGVPRDALQLLHGFGQDVGAALTKSAKVNGVAFTGSTNTAKLIHKNIADHLAPDAPFIAETGGLNAMIVDSTALIEQAVRDVVTSAFQSAGQRCSACRVLYIQEDIADKFLRMLFGAIDALIIGDPEDLTTDIGPVINLTAYENIMSSIHKAKATGRLLKLASSIPDQGYFIPPAVIEISSIRKLRQEIFGPVLHIIRFKSHSLPQIISEINTTGYGLTFAMHSRIDAHIDLAVQNIRAGNIYINRSQIGAVVGSQPFGGEGLSGTGPKAGGPLYLHRFYQNADFSDLPKSASLPGPTGESNQWSRRPRGRILCLGPGLQNACEAALLVEREGAQPIVNTDLDAQELTKIENIDGVIYWGENPRAYLQALARREGAIIPLITSRDLAPYLWLERHVSIDTTASGGNVELMSSRQSKVECSLISTSC